MQIERINKIADFNLHIELKITSNIDFFFGDWQILYICGMKLSVKSFHHLLLLLYV